jgi:hypothetical protein
MARLKKRSYKNRRNEIMKHTTTVSELVGTNESPISGNFIVSSNREFITRKVVVGVSILTNKTKDLSGLVSAVTQTRIDAPGVNFNPGNFFSVTLESPWTIQNSDGPVIEVECNRCGFSYSSKELIRGLCKTCIDKR